MRRGFRVIILPPEGQGLRTLQVSRSGFLARVIGAGVLIALLGLGIGGYVGFRAAGYADAPWGRAAAAMGPRPVASAPTSVTGSADKGSSEDQAGSAAAEDALEAPSPAPPLVPSDASEESILELTIDGEAVEVAPFDEDGEPREVAMERLSQALGCSDRDITVDAELVRALLDTSNAIEGGRIVVHRGVRPTPVEGEEARKLHVDCKAVDIEAEGVSLPRLRHAAYRNGGRGIGLYTDEEYLHIDVGDKRILWDDRDDGEEEANDDDDGEREAAAEGS
jgi:hypothetical protein